jgi:Mg2+ and Co2+ transporter CorA
MSNDIVAQLRDMACCWRGNDPIAIELRQASDEIERLREERDEARWEVCGFHHLTGFLAGDYAISRGWNYFNDEKKWAKFPPSVTDFDKFLKAHSEQDLKTIERLQEENMELRELLGNSKQLLKERDEARREACGTDGGTIGESMLEAEQRGWDCFKKEETP